MFAGTFGSIALTLAGLAGDLPRFTASLSDGNLSGFGALVSGQGIVCQPQRETANRASPYDSTSFRLGGQMAKVCYSRPYAKQRTIFAPDGLVPFGEIWRTGANEPTTLHLPVAATIAGIEVGPGSYSLYTIPNGGEWTIIVNRSTAQWGIESRYSEEIKAQEVGRATVRSAATDQHMEQFTIRSTTAGNGSDLTIEWEGTRVSIPVRPAG